jgi:hypothetical protein
MKPKTLPRPTPIQAPTPLFTIQSPHFSQAPLSLTLDHLDQVAAAHRSDEFEHLVDLIIARDVVPVSPIDHVEVIDDALTAVHVRIVDGSERGREGWVPSAWLHTAGTQREQHDDTTLTGQAA